MNDILKEYREELPAWWTQKFKSQKLIDLVADQGNWFGRPRPVSEEGKEILKRNHRLFRYADSLGDFAYAFEPVEDILFELIPENPHRQGSGISMDLERNILELDLYFFPCDYSGDKKRDLPFMYLRVPIASVYDPSLIDAYVRKYFPDRAKGRSAVIPFSMDRAAELEGYFMDDYQKTARICRAAVKGGSFQEIQNCETFLEFVRTAGYRR
jgi:hypothetical protein